MKSKKLYASGSKNNKEVKQFQNQNYGKGSLGRGVGGAFSKGVYDFISAMFNQFCRAQVII